jgi:hypothetical protein
MLRELKLQVRIYDASEKIEGGGSDLPSLGFVFLARPATPAGLI